MRTAFNNCLLIRSIQAVFTVQVQAAYPWIWGLRFLLTGSSTPTAGPTEDPTDVTRTLFWLCWGPVEATCGFCGLQKGSECNWDSCPVHSPCGSEPAGPPQLLPPVISTSQLAHLAAALISWLFPFPARSCSEDPLKKQVLLPPAQKPTPIEAWDSPPPQLPIWEPHQHAWLLPSSCPQLCSRSQI